MTTKIAPGTICYKCKKRKATIEWVGEGGVLDWNHGFWAPYCEICATEEQLAYAKKQARRIPELKEKLQKLTESDSNA